jgi:hypothetical protein
VVAVARGPVDAGTAGPEDWTVGGKVWWWALLFVFLVAVWSAVPAIPAPEPRDFADFLDSDRGEDFFSGAWGWFALILVFVVFNTVLGEELLFRGCCCRECEPSSGGATGAPTGCCSPSITCTCRGSCRPPWWRASSLRPIPRAGSERVDGDHRPLRSERLRHRHRPRPRAVRALPLCRTRTCGSAFAVAAAPRGGSTSTLVPRPIRSVCAASQSSEASGSSW